MQAIASFPEAYLTIHPPGEKRWVTRQGEVSKNEFLSRPALMLDYLMLKFFGWKELFKSDPLDRLGFQRVSRKPFSSSLDYLLEYNTSRSNHFSNQPLIMKDWWLGVKSFDYEESSSYPKRRDPLIGEHLSSDLKLNIETIFIKLFKAHVQYMVKMTYQHMYERKSYYMIVTNWLEVNSVMFWRYCDHVCFLPWGLDKASLGSLSASHSEEKKIF